MAPCLFGRLPDLVATDRDGCSHDRVPLLEQLGDCGHEAGRDETRRGSNAQPSRSLPNKALYYRLSGRQDAQIMSKKGKTGAGEAIR